MWKSPIAKGCRNASLRAPAGQLSGSGSCPSGRCLCNAPAGAHCDTSPFRGPPPVAYMSSFLAPPASPSPPQQ
eukprot:958796-Rhodomonas_salina.2